MINSSCRWSTGRSKAAPPIAKSGHSVECARDAPMTSRRRLRFAYEPTRSPDYAARLGSVVTEQGPGAHHDHPPMPGARRQQPYVPSTVQEHCLARSVIMRMHQQQAEGLRSANKTTCGPTVHSRGVDDARADSLQCCRATRPRRAVCATRTGMQPTVDRQESAALLGKPRDPPTPR